MTENIDKERLRKLFLIKAGYGVMFVGPDGFETPSIYDHDRLVLIFEQAAHKLDNYRVCEPTKNTDYT